MIESYVTCIIQVIVNVVMLLVTSVILTVIFDDIFPEEQCRCDDTHLLSSLPDKKVVKERCTFKGKLEKTGRNKNNCNKSQLIQCDDVLTNEALFSKNTVNENRKIYGKDSQSVIDPLNQVENLSSFKGVKCINFEKSSEVLFFNGFKQQNNEKDSELMSLSDLRYSCCEGLNSQISKQQYHGKDNVLEPSKVLLNKNLNENSSNAQLLSKRDDGKLDKARTLKDFNNTNLDGSFPNSQLQSNTRDEEKLGKALFSKSFHSRFLHESCLDSQLISNEKHDRNLDKAILSEDLQCKNLAESCSNSQLLFKEQDEKLSNALQAKELIKNQSIFNSQLLSKKQDNRKPDKVLPSKDFLKTNIVESCSDSQILSISKENEKLEKTLASKDIENNKFKNYFFNFHIVFKQQNKRMKRRVDSKIREIPQEVMTSLYDHLGEKLCNADVNFFSKENKPYLSAHSTVLAAKSKYFQDLLYGDLASKSRVLDMDLEINNVSFCVLFNIIKWFYTGKIEFSNDYTVLEIYKAAIDFKIQELIDKCRNYIESMEITDHNVLSNLELSNAMRNDELNRLCIKYIEKNTLLVINSEEFLKSSFNIVKKICELQLLSLTSESEMLEALVKWLNAQLKMKKNAVKNLERALLRCVRFLNFSAEEFVDAMSKHGALFNPDESLSIFMYLVDPTPEDFKKLPSWCNKSYRTLPKKIGKRVRMDLPIRKLEIQLKVPDIEQNISELTSILEMRCMSGVHQLKSVKFSFQSIGYTKCVLKYLEIKIRILPNGKGMGFHRVKKLPLKNSEITFNFLEGVTVYESQVLRMEVTANMSQCNFYQFDKWFPQNDFDCFFISKPITERLYFISEVVYGPLVP